ncbi:hypothetical protein [Botrimarina sp.]|uniref:hypothetical protein n=1 Tax=Botrimarina sp. TaxID=2795802 RepID=UPI0032F09A55
MRIATMLLALGAGLAPAPLWAVGHFNMPTSLQQYLGVGFGPGYHAPMLLGPRHKARVAAQRVRRLPAPLLPPPRDAGFSAPACLGAGAEWPMSSHNPAEGPSGVLAWPHGYAAEGPPAGSPAFARPRNGEAR